VTIPLASASSNVYTVTFDGTLVSILAAKRQKLLRQFPVSQLQALEYRPARGPAGGRIRFRVAGSSSTRDTIVFTRGQEQDMARLAEVVQRYVRPPTPLVAGVDPWPDVQIDRSRTIVHAQLPRSFRTLSTLNLWLTAIPLVLYVIVGLLVLAGVGYLLFS
jgi:hypothetical protein